MRSLGLLSVAHAVNHSFAVLLPPIFLAIIDEFGVTVQSVAFLAAAGSLVSGLVQLSYAELTRHVSRRRLLGFGGLLFGGGFAAMALAVNFVTFAIPNIVARVGGSPQHPVGNGLLAEQFPPDRRGFAISAHIAGGNAGTVVIAVVGAPMLAVIGWRGVAVVFGAAARSVPRSRTNSRIAIPTAMAGNPNTIEAPRQPTAAMSGTPMSATTTVPTLPPAMWALIAKPRRSVGNCSASRPLPTGCWGELPMRDAMFGIAKLRKPVARACAAIPPPNRIPPNPSSRRRETTRVR